MKKEKYTVTGMTCSACSSRVEKAVSSLKGMEKASVNLLTNSMQVEYDDSILSSTDIENAVVNAGYGIGGSDATSSSAKSEKNNEKDEMLHRLVYSFVFLLQKLVSLFLNGSRTYFGEMKMQLHLPLHSF